MFHWAAIKKALFAQGLQLPAGNDIHDNDYESHNGVGVAETKKEQVVFEGVIKSGRTEFEFHDFVGVGNHDQNE